jgi:hypothetical protein
VMNCCILRRSIAPKGPNAVRITADLLCIMEVVF